MTITLHLPENAGPILADYLARTQPTHSDADKLALRQFLQIRHRVDGAAVQVVENAAANILFALRSKRSREMRVH